jgi:hypothetical protein
MKTQCSLLMDRSTELSQAVDNGPIALSTGPTVSLVRPTVNGDKWMGLTFVPQIVDDALRAIRECVGISCCFDPVTDNPDNVKAALRDIDIAFQLAKPTRSFAKHWFQLDANLNIENCKPSLARIGSGGAYLAYQQCHQVTLEDVEIVKKCLPRLRQAFVPVTTSGSWGHPAGPVHRALVLFAQGYLPEMFQELRQYLWAMALDCLLSSRIDKTKRGARTVNQRLKILFGAEFEPYKSPRIAVPIGQGRPVHKLSNIALDIFQLRNACAHGLPIPEAWLTHRDEPEYSGYAYQLSECTEILLRQTLLLILGDQRLFDVFVDNRKLDKYFG